MSLIPKRCRSNEGLPVLTSRIAIRLRMGGILSETSQVFEIRGPVVRVKYVANTDVNPKQLLHHTYRVSKQFLGLGVEALALEIRSLLVPRMNCWTSSCSRHRLERSLYIVIHLERYTRRQECTVLSSFHPFSHPRDFQNVARISGSESQARVCAQGCLA